MPQFFISPAAAASGSRALLDERESHHIRDVLGLRAGGRIGLFDGAGRAFDAAILSLDSGGRVEVEILSSRPSAQGLRLEAYQACCDFAVMDDLVRALSEAGVSAFYPLISRNAFIKSPEKIGKRAERWEKIALASAKQCGRADCLEVGVPVGLEQALEKVKTQGALALFGRAGNPADNRKALDALAALKNKTQIPVSVMQFVGPEGGFTSGEEEMLLSGGVLPLTLGPNVFRAQTASLAMACMVFVHHGPV